MKRQSQVAVVAGAVLALLLALSWAGPAQAASSSGAAPERQRNGQGGGSGDRLAFGAAAAAETPLPVDGGWQEFDFAGAGTIAVTYRLRTEAEAWLRVTDLFCAGDRFRILDNGQPLRQTSAPSTASCDAFTASPREAEPGDEWSSGGWILSPGLHRITILVTASPFEGGSAVVRVDSPSLARAVLTGQAEVPGPGDVDGTGRASVLLLRAQAAVCYTLTVQRIGDVLAGHIHAGEQGVAGPVVVSLELPAGPGTSFAACVPASRDVIRAIAYAPWDYYVNVHTPAFPDGAIRGQLAGLHT
jgi:CHRD domain